MPLVRQARPEDAVAIATAHVEGWRVAYRGLVSDDVLDHPNFLPIRLRGWSRRLEHGPTPGAGDPDNTIFSVSVDGEVVGFGHVGMEAHPPPAETDRGEIYGFYVHPDHWGSGVSDALMETCLAELGRRFDRAVLWTLRDNPRSRGFYERHGWRCGDGDDVQVETWEGPIMDGLPSLDRPLHNIQYRRTVGMPDG